MHRFQTKLVSGKKVPYDSWTFLIVPDKLARAWGAGQKAVRGTISGASFRGTASRGEGVLRIPVPRGLRDELGVGVGDRVVVALELDPDPRPVDVPNELRSVFNDHPGLAALYEGLPPAHRRAWATYVAEAVRSETRLRRARSAAGGIRARAFPR